MPPDWALTGMSDLRRFQHELLPARECRYQDTETISAVLNMPVMIGEWHFGALDVGLPASGIGHVHDQAARGQAYRVYLEDAAANPYCVGVHWFTLYDQSALGRFDGENYNIGFLDVCNRPYEELGGRGQRQPRANVRGGIRGRLQKYADAPTTCRNCSCSARLTQVREVFARAVGATALHRSFEPRRHEEPLSPCLWFNARVSSRNSSRRDILSGAGRWLPRCW